ncbi:MAG: hypothetical protein EA396_05655, partial [Anaerolineaceae bacterium]
AAELSRDEQVISAYLG